MHPIALLFIAALSACASAGKTPASRDPEVVVISIDGFRPDFYQNKRFRAPFLKGLAANGATADGVAPIYPSVTYPNHTTLVTGTKSGKHGVHSNRVFSLETGPTLAWYWESSKIRVPTIWQAAKSVGKTTATINWPVTVGSDADWVIPEVFPENSFAMDLKWKLTRKNSTPGLFEEILAAQGSEPFKESLDHDAWMAGAASTILKKHRPNLLLLHLPHIDLVQHWNGTDSRKLDEAVEQVDQMVAKFVSQLDLARTCLFILGDHGFKDVSKEVRLNFLFRQKGWIHTDAKGEISNWRVVAHLSGAQAAVYVKDASLEKAVLDLLKRNASGKYRLIFREELKELDAFPHALVAVEPEDGFAISDETQGPLVQQLEKTHGEHGFLPVGKGTLAGLIVAGSCTKPGTRLGSIQMTDIAPTLARLLGTSLPSADGKPVPLTR